MHQSQQSGNAPIIPRCYTPFLLDLSSSFSQLSSEFGPHWSHRIFYEDRPCYLSKFQHLTEPVQPISGFAGKTPFEEALVDSLGDRHAEYREEVKPFFYTAYGIKSHGDVVSTLWPYIFRSSTSKAVTLVTSSYYFRRHSKRTCCFLLETNISARSLNS